MHNFYGKEKNTFEVHAHWPVPDENLCAAGRYVAYPVPMLQENIEVRIQY